MSIADIIPKRFHIKNKLSESSTSIIYSAKDNEDKNIVVIKLTKDATNFDFHKEVLMMKLILQLQNDLYVQYKSRIVSSINSKKDSSINSNSINSKKDNSTVNNINNINNNNSNSNSVNNSSSITSEQQLLPKLTFGIIMNSIPETKTLFDHISLLSTYPFIFESVMRQLFSALNLLHTNNIVHRDIKLENILFSTATGKITLIDFGSAAVIPNLLSGNNSSNLSSEFEECILKSNSVTGTICNFSPEIVYATKENNSILHLVDCWAAGATMYTIATGTFIVDDTKYKNLSTILEFFSSHEYFHIRNKIDNFNAYPHNPYIANTIKLCLTHSYTSRPLCSQLL